jgi:hypothetical protein
MSPPNKPVLDWNKLSHDEQQAMIRARKLSGHTSVAEHDRIRLEQARAHAFGEACDWLTANGYPEAAAALEAVAFIKAEE